MSTNNTFEANNWPVTIRSEAAATAQQTRVRARKVALVFALIAFFVVIALTSCGRRDEAGDAVSPSAPSDVEAQTAELRFPTPPGTFWDRGYCWFDSDRVREIRDIDGGSPLLLLYRGEYPLGSQCRSAP